MSEFDGPHSVMLDVPAHLVPTVHRIMMDCGYDVSRERTVAKHSKTDASEYILKRRKQACDDVEDLLGLHTLPDSMVGFPLVYTGMAILSVNVIPADHVPLLRVYQWPLERYGRDGEKDRREEKRTKHRFSERQVANWPLVPGKERTPRRG